MYIEDNDNDNIDNINTNTNDENSTSRKEKFYSGLVYILAVATFMTLFELLFFTLLISPKETEIIENFIKQNKLFNFDDELPISIPKPIPKPNITYNTDTDITKIFMENSNDFLNVLIIRENNMIKQLNLQYILFITFMIIMMIFFIIFVYTRINFSSTIGNILLAVKTVVILCFFQLNMYFFALGFLYTTKEELQLLIYDKIINDLKT